MAAATKWNVPNAIKRIEGCMQFRRVNNLYNLRGVLEEIRPEVSRFCYQQWPSLSSLCAVGIWQVGRAGLYAQMPTHLLHMDGQERPAAITAGGAAHDVQHGTGHGPHACRSRVSSRLDVRYQKLTHDQDHPLRSGSQRQDADQQRRDGRLAADFEQHAEPLPCASGAEAAHVGEI